MGGDVLDVDHRVLDELADLEVTALDVLRSDTRDSLESMDFRLHGVQVDEFEKAGGSLRCLIAEVF